MCAAKPLGLGWLGLSFHRPSLDGPGSHTAPTPGMRGARHMAPSPLGAGGQPRYSCARADVTLSALALGAAYPGSDRLEDIKQGFLFVIRELASIHKQAMTGTCFEAQVGLLGVGNFDHRRLTAGARHITYSVIGLAYALIATVDKIRHPRGLQLLCLAVIEPQAMTTFTLIDANRALQRLYRSLKHC